jgi:hypothetical protein
MHKNQLTIKRPVTAHGQRRTIHRTSATTFIIYREQFFRMIRCNVRKRTGNLATGRLLFFNGDTLAIFQNLGIPD